MCGASNKKKMKQNEEQEASNKKELWGISLNTALIGTGRGGVWDFG